MFIHWKGGLNHANPMFAALDVHTLRIPSYSYAGWSRLTESFYTTSVLAESP
jgi:hypothetical protein